MSAKKQGQQNRWRNITVGFRVSPEESEQIDKGSTTFGAYQAGLYHKTALMPRCGCAGQSESV